ncbi:MAG: hypothetical protein SO471_07920 [Anaerobutyricum hallii]|nr:hypothetical protein [Anaerobutyricum hallii]
MNLPFALRKHATVDFLLVCPPHRLEQFAHFSSRHTLELTLDGQRINRTLDAADTLAILMTDEENELHITVFGVHLTNTQSLFSSTVSTELSVVALQPRHQIGVLGVDDSRVVSVSGVVGLKQRQGIITHTTVTTAHSVIRAFSTSCAPSTAQRQGLHHIILIHKNLQKNKNLP